MTDERLKSLAALREVFPAEQVGRLPRANVTLDYVGHGAVTSRLLDVDPEWNWEPLAVDESGRPVFEVANNGAPVGLWIKLTVLGVTRLGFGSCSGGQFDAEKVLIGDALRNAAMRFGVALDLWIRGHAEDDETVSAQDTRSRPERGSGRPGRSGPPRCAVCDAPAIGPIVKQGDSYVHKDCIAPAEKPSEEPF